MLENILKAREQRWFRRLKTVEKYLLPVVTITLNIPGPQKDAEIFIKTHKVITGIFLDLLNTQAGFLVTYREDNLDYDGPETLLAVKGEALDLKKLALEIEEKHPLGCLVDIDVMDERQNILSRLDLNRPERSCLVCGQKVRSCIATKKHTWFEVMEIVKQIIDMYFSKSHKGDF